MIEHWCDIVRAVFKAEDAMPEIWNERLREAKTAGPELRDKICEGYVRAIATEIIDGSGLRVHVDVAAERLSEALGVMHPLFGIDIRKRSRMREYVDLRIVFCYRMRREGLSYSAIGRAIGRDHSTVISCCERMKDALDYPNAFQELVGKYRRFNEALWLFDRTGK